MFHEKHLILYMTVLLFTVTLPFTFLSRFDFCIMLHFPQHVLKAQPLNLMDLKSCFLEAAFLVPV